MRLVVFVCNALFSVHAASAHYASSASVCVILWIIIRILHAATLSIIYCRLCAGQQKPGTNIIGSLLFDCFDAGAVFVASRMLPITEFYKWLRYRLCGAVVCDLITRPLVVRVSLYNNVYWLHYVINVINIAGSLSKRLRTWSISVSTNPTSNYVTTVLLARSFLVTTA